MVEKVLVTGGTGFVGTQIIFQLLQKGYEVKTTVRSMASKNKLLDVLKQNGISSFEQLQFVEADLSKDDHWDEAMDGCDYVLSVASPVFFEVPKEEAQVMRPAIEGITRILKAAKAAKVKRVVMTSNFGAVGFSNKDKNVVTTEADWTDPNEKGLSIYEKSKLLAEKAAWDFIQKEGRGLEFVTINPVAIFGPALSAHISGSFMLLERVLSGSAIPNIPLNIVDVRDVADMHIRAMTNPQANGERFIASADGQITLPEMAELLKRKRPELATKISSKRVPNWLVNLGALFNQEAKEAALLLKLNRDISNTKAKQLLNWQPVANNEEIVLASVDSMVKFKRIQS
ncbi:NAD-dependent epimerase/dehydratase family protein [Listeria costaricensis]|uniref:NAD-dependent epimerase/dehydratase family protein n=1 Tax=Listeria costaricensis TaxID=2026604 RepID=UPI000C07A50A|nr:NAD-dependent epimerase/dehydratase family protein [Listeria costaricensis]